MRLKKWNNAPARERGHTESTRNVPIHDQNIVENGGQLSHAIF